MRVWLWAACGFRQQKPDAQTPLNSVLALPAYSITDHSRYSSVNNVFLYISSPTPSLLCFYICALSVCLPMQVEKPSIQSSKPKKTSTSHKPPRKAKDKQVVSGQAAKKKTTEGPGATKPDDKEPSKEMNNKLAEAKE